MKTDLTKFQSRYEHAYNKILHNVPAHVRSGKFLDIGCGIGNGVVAALKHGASLALGVDRSLSEFGHMFHAEEFPEICRHYGVPADRALLLGADLFDLGFPANSFDYVFMLDSIEHVPNPQRFIQYAAGVLRPGGVFLVDTCPLYYSPLGHHLWKWFPLETDPWAHLRPDFRDRIKELQVDDWSIQRFEELNRVTHNAVRQYFTAAGFEIIEEVRSRQTEQMHALFERVGPSLDLNGIEKDWLFEDWILLVGQKV
jgi:SAM-dependent methyltransferase